MATTAEEKIRTISRTETPNARKNKIQLSDLIVAFCLNPSADPLFACETTIACGWGNASPNVTVGRSSGSWCSCLRCQRGSPCKWSCCKLGRSACATVNRLDRCIVRTMLRNRGGELLVFCMLQLLGHEPLRPQNGGGKGVREIVMHVSRDVVRFVAIQPVFQESCFSWALSISPLFPLATAR